MKPEVTKLVKLRRNKASAIIKNVLAKREKEILVEILRDQFFCLLVDESTDIKIGPLKNW